MKCEKLIAEAFKNYFTDLTKNLKLKKPKQLSKSSTVTDIAKLQKTISVICFAFEKKKESHMENIKATIQMFERTCKRSRNIRGISLK